MKRSDEGMCADFYHLGFRRNSGSGRGARCRCRRCDRAIVDLALRRRPVFRRRLREWLGYCRVVEAEEHTDPQVWVDECNAQFRPRGCHFELGQGRMESN
jgi:hypothetical protein